MEHVATAAFPIDSPLPDIQFLTNPPPNLDKYLQEFMASMNLGELVTACVGNLKEPKLQIAKANVAEICSDDFGKLEVTILKVNIFTCLFHRDSVYTREGLKATEHDYFRGRPLSDMVRMDFILLGQASITSQILFRFKLVNQ